MVCHTKKWLSVWFALVVLSLYSCSHDEELATKERAEDVVVASSESSSDSPSLSPEEDLYRKAATFSPKNVYFSFDKSVVESESFDNLQRLADYMQANSNVSLIIEGHCDERGTNEYNLALGQRRAESVKAYLVNLGIVASRISTVSYGEEKLWVVKQNMTREDHKKNRRAEFVLGTSL